MWIKGLNYMTDEKIQIVRKKITFHGTKTVQNFGVTTYHSYIIVKGLQNEK